MNTPSIYLTEIEWLKELEENSGLAKSLFCDRWNIA